MIIAYPVIFTKTGDKKDTYLVYIPDMSIYTEGSSLTDAIEMARDAIGLKGITIEDMGDEIPLPSDTETAIEKAKEDADDEFDYSTGIMTLVDVNFAEYRMKNDNKMVRRNVTLPVG